MSGSESKKKMATKVDLFAGEHATCERTPSSAEVFSRRHLRDQEEERFVHLRSLIFEASFRRQDG